MNRTLWISSPMGWWCLESTDTQVVALHGPVPSIPGTAPSVSSQPDLAPDLANASPSRLEQRLQCMLSRYFKGQPVDFSPVPVQLSGSAFQQAILQTLRTIPFGETRSYQWLASHSGNPRAARAVGGALGRNPIPVILPCHRVITSAGGLGGFMSGRMAADLALKVDLLTLEGIVLGEAGLLADLSNG